jgi:DNA-binding transcriptional MerR regulator
MRELERATGVGRETIRFYIREGLLPEPDRPGRNVAWYDPSFVERITLIKELQQKRFLPLHVIKTILGGPEATPSRNEVQALLELDGKLFPAVAGGPAVPPERVTQLTARTGLPVAHVRELATAGAIELVTRDGDVWLEGDAIRVVEIWATLWRAGFTEALGFRPANLRLYVDMVSWLAREELRLFTRGIAGRVDTEKARRMAEDGITYLNQLMALLRKTTLLRYIAQGNVPPADAAPVPISARRRTLGVRALRGPRRARRPAPKPR